MRVTISVIGRFHAFNLAYQLYRRGHLQRLITTYPKFETTKYGIPDSHVVSHLPIEVCMRLWQKVPTGLRGEYNLQVLGNELADRLAARRIPEDTEIFVGWSSSSLQSLNRAREMGAIALLERGSSHMRYQKRILEEEYAKAGLTAQVVHPRIYERELQEYEAADYIVIPSSFVKATFVEEGIPQDKLVQIPYGVNPIEFQALPKTDKTFRIIHCGALTLRKGVHYLLQAFHEMKLPDTELWLVGSLGKEILPFLQRYDNGKVFHRGPYPQRELFRHYSQGSVFCLASIEEGLAMVIPQAMACGLPVVCTANTGGADLVREGQDGWIVPIRDVEALKEKLTHLYEHPERCRAMGQSAKERILQRFTWNHYGDTVTAAYSNIVEQRTQ